MIQAEIDIFDELIEENQLSGDRLRAVECCRGVADHAAAALADADDDEESRALTRARNSAIALARSVATGRCKPSVVFNALPRGSRENRIEVAKTHLASLSDREILAGATKPDLKTSPETTAMFAAEWKRRCASLPVGRDGDATDRAMRQILKLPAAPVTAGASPVNDLTARDLAEIDAIESAEVRAGRFTAEGWARKEILRADIRDRAKLPDVAPAEPEARANWEWLRGMAHPGYSSRENFIAARADELRGGRSFHNGKLISALRD